jgi:hypothetical protein
MQELSPEEMISLGGGSFNFAKLLSLGNIGIAIPINLEILSNNALFGGGVTSSVVQFATNEVGNQFLNQAFRL